MKRKVLATLGLSTALSLAPLVASRSQTSGSCVSSSSSWQSASFPAQSGAFTAAFDATPAQAGMDGVVGLAPAAATDFTSLAAIVRFNNQGFIDARNGGAYAAAAQIPYLAGLRYHFRLAVDIPAHAYSVYVTAPGGSETLLGSNYAFRSEQAAASSLGYWALMADSGGEQVCNFSAAAAAASGSTLVASQSWLNAAFPQQTSAFTASFDATPSNAAADDVIGLSHAAATAYTSLAAIVRFNATGTIDARNGSVYAAAIPLPYSAGATYHFRLAVDLSAHTYSIYVTPPGASETLVGSNYAFRTEQAGVSSLGNLALIAGVGTEQVSNFAVSAPSAPPPSAPPPSSASAYNQTILNDHPILFLAMDTPGSGSQADLSGQGRNGVYKGGIPTTATLPNGERAADFNGSSEYLSVPASPALSVPASGILTIESWIRPDTLQFPHQEAEGYVYWLGKGNPTDGYEYANRMYSLTNTANRPNRISDYAWNTSGSLGSGAYFQDSVNTTNWILVTDIIDMKDTSSSYPTGYISIYKNGVLRGQVPLNQYNVVPGTTNSPFNVGTRNYNSWFEGAVGKVAVYNYALSASQIANHYAAMTGGATTAGFTTLSLSSADSGGTSSPSASTSTAVAGSTPTTAGATTGFKTLSLSPSSGAGASSSSASTSAVGAATTGPAQASAPSAQPATTLPNAGATAVPAPTQTAWGPNKSVTPTPPAAPAAAGQAHRRHHKK